MAQDERPITEQNRVGSLLLQELATVLKADPKLPGAAVTFADCWSRFGPDGDVTDHGSYGVWYFTVTAAGKTTKELQFFVFGDQSEKQEWVVECIGVRDTIDLSRPETCRAFLDRLRLPLSLRLT